MGKENELALSQPQKGINIFGSIEGFETGQRIARVFASSVFVPDVYKNNIGNCLISLNMALRMNADPLMVMQNLVIVHGTPTFEAKFAIACFNATGKYSSINYEEVGVKGTDSYGMLAWAIETNTGEVKKGPEITIKMAKDEGWFARNPKWKNIPQLMLRYRAASWFIRTTDPGVMFGFKTREEVEDADYEEIPITEPSNNEPSAEEQLAAAQEKEQKEANSQQLGMNNGAKEAQSQQQGNNEGEEQKAAHNKENAAQNASNPKPQPMGKQEVPDMFKQ